MIFKQEPVFLKIINARNFGVRRVLKGVKACTVCSLFCARFLFFFQNNYMEGSGSATIK